MGKAPAFNPLIIPLLLPHQQSVFTDDQAAPPRGSRARTVGPVSHPSPQEAPQAAQRPGLPHCNTLQGLGAPSFVLSSSSQDLGCPQSTGEVDQAWQGGGWGALQALAWPEAGCPCRGAGTLPVYSGKQMVSGDFLIFSSNMSFLLRNKMMDVSVNHLLLQMLSKSFRDSCMRFCNKAERQVRAGSARGPDSPRPPTAEQAKERPTSVAERTTEGQRRGTHRTHRTRSLFHSTRRQAGAEQGGQGEECCPPPPQEGRPCLGQRRPWRGSGSRTGHAPCTQGQHRHPTRLHGTTGHADFSTGVSFGFTSGGGRVHTFRWETLTEV